MEMLKAVQTMKFLIVEINQYNIFKVIYLSRVIGDVCGLFEGDGIASEGLQAARDYKYKLKPKM